MRVNDETLAQKMRSLRPRYSTPSFLRQVKIGLQYAGFGLVYRPRLYWPVRNVFHRLSAIGAAEGNYNTVCPQQMHPDFLLDMAPLQRGLLRAKQRNLRGNSEHRKRIVHRYREVLGDRVRAPTEPVGAEVIYARFPVIVEHKERALASAQREGVELAEWYATPVHPLRDQDLEIVGYGIGSCRYAEALCQSVVSLPTHRRVSDNFVRRVGTFFANLVA